MIHQLDSIQFRLKEQQDFRWLKRYGEAFWVVDETGSGCICIGMERAGKKYFCKIAGVNTIEAEISPEESIEVLKRAVPLYQQLKHPNLVKLIEAYQHGPFYVAVFEWAQGECLFDHWNFETYQQNAALKSPKQRFLALPAGEKLRAVDALFSFLQHTAQQGYVAVDFYDGSLMYQFATGKLTICDIDFFRKAPVVNDRGPDWFGTKRLKAPEEYLQGAVIDEQTNLFTLGALLFEFFGRFTQAEIRWRYADKKFLPCQLSCWQLNERSYQVACKAVNLEKAQRYQTFADFYRDWKQATCGAKDRMTIQDRENIKEEF